MLITLTEWDKKNFSIPHRRDTLQKWARESRFTPTAEKHGREWWVDEEAELVPINRSTEYRLRQAQAMMSDEPVTDLDPRVLEILNHGSRAA